MLTSYPFIFNYLLKDIHPEWAIKMLDDGGEEEADGGGEGLFFGHHVAAVLDNGEERGGRARAVGEQEVGGVDGAGGGLFG
mgnify:CR=1 FL=1